MRLFDTRRRRAEPFDTRSDVQLYVCGVTPYDTTHLGHARTYAVFDVLVRHLRARGRRVRYVQNITDVDDSILARAAEVGVDYAELGRRYTDVYMADMRDLNMLPADVYPAASDSIPEIRKLISKLLDRGHAYRLDNGDVFFRVRNAPAYGALSGLTRPEMLEVESDQDGSTVDDPRKEDALDFVLWRGARPGEPTWDSPWGPGRPGWHIECSAMAMAHLSPQIDIHGGGADLVFPHHEAEIAQSEAATGKRPFARFWVHVALVSMDGAKMSKSLGNLVFVRDLLRDFSPDAVRLYILSCHYRDELEYARADVESAQRLADRLAAAVARDGGDAAVESDRSPRLVAALDDDLDTPEAIAVLSELADDVLEGDAPPGAPAELARLGDVLGLGLRAP